MSNYRYLVILTDEFGNECQTMHDFGNLSAAKRYAERLTKNSQRLKGHGWAFSIFKFEKTQRVADYNID